MPAKESKIIGARVWRRQPAEADKQRLRGRDGKIRRGKRKDFSKKWWKTIDPRARRDINVLPTTDRVDR